MPNSPSHNSSTNPDDSGESIPKSPSNSTVSSEAETPPQISMELSATPMDIARVGMLYRIPRNPAHEFKIPNSYIPIIFARVLTEIHPEHPGNLNADDVEALLLRNYLDLLRADSEEVQSESNENRITPSELKDIEDESIENNRRTPTDSKNLSSSNKGVPIQSSQQDTAFRALIQTAPSLPSLNPPDPAYLALIRTAPQLPTLPVPTAQEHQHPAHQPSSYWSRFFGCCPSSNRQAQTVSVSTQVLRR